MVRNLQYTTHISIACCLLCLLTARVADWGTTVFCSSCCASIICMLATVFWECTYSQQYHTYCSLPTNSQHILTGVSTGNIYLSSTSDDCIYHTVPPAVCAYDRCSLLCILLPVNGVHISCCWLFINIGISHCCSARGRCIDQ